MKVLFCYFLIVNAVAFVLIAYDKYLAKAQKMRIPERTLFGSVFLGGTIGSGLAMLIFRHKTVKTSYLLKFFGIVLIQIALIYLCFHFDFLEYKI